VSLTNLFWQNTQILHDASECGHIIHPRGCSGHHEGLLAKGGEEQKSRCLLPQKGKPNSLTPANQYTINIQIKTEKSA